jgi:Xaa-Pro aminopeptidase
LVQRIRRCEEALKGWGVDGLLIEDPTDLLYFTGLHLSLGRLIVTKKGSCLFVDGRYLEKCQAESPVEVRPWDEAKAFGARVKKLGFDTGKTTVAEKKLLDGLFPRKLRPVDHPTRGFRLVKDASELTAMRKSAELLWKGFLHAQKCLKVGLTEEALSWEFEKFVRAHGATGLAFTPIIAFGENSSRPHHETGARKLKRGDLVLIDIGVIVDGYRSDMTRVVRFGTIPEKLRLIEEVVRRSHRAALRECRAGVTVGALDLAARQVMRAEGVEDLFVHSLGHGIGLETHEFPRLKSQGVDGDVVLEPGMVITIEPGLYLPGVGGVRHEDTIIVTKRGYENLYPE